MSEDRETPAGANAAHEGSTGGTPQKAGVGSPVEETEATNTDVRAAVGRAGGLSAESDTTPEPTTVEPVAEPEPTTTNAAAEPPASMVDTAEYRTPVAEPNVLPSAGPEEATAATPAREPLGPTKDANGNIVISADHPMAALYMQTPTQPELRGNRGAGVMIAVLATLAFAAIYTGVIALWIAPGTPPSRFVSTLTDAALWPVTGASIAFFIGLTILVLIVGRAGWWAYVLGGFLVAVLAWVGAMLGSAYAVYQADGGSALTELVNDGVAGGGVTPLGVVNHFGLLLPVIGAAIVARETTVWFGAWIGARGKKITRKNTEAIAEYETALAEAQAKQP